MSDLVKIYLIVCIGVSIVVFGIVGGWVLNEYIDSAYPDAHRGSPSIKIDVSGDSDTHCRVADDGIGTGGNITILCSPKE